MMNNNRCIGHVDKNSAFLSISAVQMLKNGYKIDIREIPSIIAGNSLTRHGIVLTKSESDKKYGIKTDESLYSALKKCPNLTAISPLFIQRVSIVEVTCKCFIWSRSSNLKVRGVEIEG